MTLMVVSLGSEQCFNKELTLGYAHGEFYLLLHC